MAAVEWLGQREEAGQSWEKQAVWGLSETPRWNLAFILSEMGARDGLKQRTHVI